MRARASARSSSTSVVAGRRSAIRSGLCMARVYSGRPTLPLARLERAASSGLVRRRPGAGLEGLREDRPRSSARSFFALLYADPAAAGAPVPEPGPSEGRAGAHLAEHGGQLHHQHELAVLRRRVHDVVPDPDGRARGAELRLGRGRHGGARGGRPRDLRAARGSELGNFWVDLYRTLRLHPAAARRGPRRDPDRRRASSRPSTATRRRRRSRARSRRSRAARPPRRSRSSSSARTAAASTTRTRPSRSRTRTASRTSSRCSRSC